MDSEAFLTHIAEQSAFAERFGVSIEAVDRGAALATLTSAQAAHPNGNVRSASLLALAQTSSTAAIDGALAPLAGRIDHTPSHSSLTHIAAASGAVRAAAMVQRVYADDLIGEIGSLGSAQCRVDVALVDEDGRTVARGHFDVTVARRD